MGMGADARPRDLALLGLMVQQGGAWEDRQIVCKTGSIRALNQRESYLESTMATFGTRKTISTKEKGFHQG